MRITLPTKGDTLKKKIEISTNEIKSNRIAFMCKQKLIITTQQ